MKRTIFLLVIIVVSISVMSCAPVTLQKCIVDHKYDASGKIQSTYSECITQTPEKTAPVHLKHQELYD